MVLCKAGVQYVLIECKAEALASAVTKRGSQSYPTTFFVTAEAGASALHYRCSIDLNSRRVAPV